MIIQELYKCMPVCAENLFFRLLGTYRYNVLVYMYVLNYSIDFTLLKLHNRIYMIN